MKILLFVSDIVGTIDKGTPDNYKELGKLLSLLKEKHGADQVIFSLCTSDMREQFLMNSFNTIQYGFKGTGITYGKQFFSLGYIQTEMFQTGIITDQYGEIDKIETIIKYVQELQEYDEIVALYYVDDIIIYNRDVKYIESRLNNKVYYHFINPGSIENISSEHLSTSTEENILGLIQCLKLHLGIENVKSDNQEHLKIQNAKDQIRIQQERALEEQRIALELKQKNDKKVTQLQFIDIGSNQRSEDYNKWIKKQKGRFFGETQANILFCNDYSDYLDSVSKVRPDDNSYSLYEILKVLSSIDLLTIMLLYCDRFQISYDMYFHYEREKDIQFTGVCKDHKVSAPILKSNKNLYIDKSHSINMIEFLMRQEKIPLYSLIDTLIFVNRQYNINYDVSLRNKINPNNSLFARIVEIRDSEFYNSFNFENAINIAKQRKLRYDKYLERKNLPLH